MKSGSRYGIFNIYILIRKIDKFNRHLRKVRYKKKDEENLWDAQKSEKSDL